MARTQLSDRLPGALDPAPPRRLMRFDPATIVGFASAFGFLLIGIVLGGPLLPFIDVPSLFIVIGGTLGVTLISFSVGDVVAAHKASAKVLFRSIIRAQAIAQRMLTLAELARKQGVLALERTPDAATGNPVAAKALRMVIEGVPPNEIERILERDIAEMTQRHARSANVLRKAAEVAPAMGLIGTLIGLVQMLGNLQDPSTIGPAMAVALLTTFYGAVLACMVLAPLAVKLDRRSSAEALVANVCMLAAVSMGRQENPRRLEMMLNAILPPSERVQHFD